MLNLDKVYSNFGYKINDWEKNIKLELNTLRHYIQRCGGMRKIRNLLNIRPISSDLFVLSIICISQTYIAQMFL